ncbi:MAG: dihydrofolate reductase family protein [Brevinema sp.]
MRNLILYIAQSLDGYIASEDGSIDWLPQDFDPLFAKPYEDLCARVDTVLMGRKTFDQINTELSPDFWPYENHQSVIFSRNTSSMPPKDRCRFEQDLSYIKTLKSESGKDIWLVGGGAIVEYCLKEDLVDEFIIATVPVIIGKGIKLFSPINQQINLSQHEIISNDKLMQVTYKKLSS